MLHEIAFIAITEDVSLIVSINLLHGRDEPAALVRAVGSLAKAPWVRSEAALRAWLSTDAAARGVRSTPTTRKYAFAGW